MTRYPAEQIERHPKLLSGQNLIVGVSGIDGSGKSTYAKELLQSLVDRGLTANLLALDDFLYPKPVRHANPDQAKGYFDENFDFKGLVEKVLDPVRQQTRVDTKIRVLELASDKSVEREFSFCGPGVLIVEGVFLFRRELRSCFDLKIWLEVSFEVAMKRILSRPRDKRYGGAEEIKRRYNERFFPAQKFHLENDNPSEAADFIPHPLDNL